jgi:prevent-host-death family protein
MTRTRPPSDRSASASWPLQDAKARFSELVRRARSEGPQHVTVHGREEVVVVAADEFRRLKGEPTGQALIDALQSSPFREIEIEPERIRLPERDFKF